MRRARLPGLLALALAFPLPAAFSDGDLEPVPAKDNLDLPFGAAATAVEEEEAPEVIFFYGQQYEGDGFFLVLGRSIDAGCGSTANALALEQREAVRMISEFSQKVHFGLVFYDAEVIRFPASGQPAEADPVAKAAAIAFVISMKPGTGRCVGKGLQEGLNLANASSARRNQIILFTDGYTDCPGIPAVTYEQETLTRITGANFKRHPIHAICAGINVSESFPKQLAAMNRGTYARVLQ